MITKPMIELFKKKMTVGHELFAPVEIASGVFLAKKATVVKRFTHHAIVEYPYTVEGFDGRPRRIVRRESFRWADLIRENMVF